MDNNDLDLDLDQIEQNVVLKESINKRIQGLAEAKLRSETERDEALKDKKALEVERDKLTKEKEFYSSFSDVVGKYPEAKDFKEKILEKVQAGYDAEDAAISILAREGKLPQARPPVAEKEIVAGGSAPNQVKGGAKPISEMTQAERRAALVEAEARGEITT